MVTAPLLPLVIPLDTGFVHWGFVNLSVPNMIMIVAMLIVFVLALAVPFPKERS